MNANGTRVLIADRHAAVRRGLRAALEGAGLDVVAECRDAAGAAAAAGRERPDVCLIDVELPGNGGAAVEAIRVLCPDARVVMLAAEVDEESFFAGLRLGAAGYLLKDVDAVRLAADVTAVAAGKAALSPEFAVHLLEAFRSRRRVPGLTPREAEVLSLLGPGLTTKQVALQLGVAPSTVRRHVSSAVKRLGAADRHEAIARLAFRGSERE